MSVWDWFRAPKYWRLIEPYWTKISIYEGPQRYLGDLADVPAHVRQLFAVHWLQSEVRNGGFGQFFDNSTGVVGPEAAEGLEQIGMPKAAAFVRSRMALFGAAYPRSREDRQALMFEHEEGSGPHPIDTLSTSVEDEFYDLLRSENGGFRVCANRYAERFLS